MRRLVLLDAGPEGSVKWKLDIGELFANQNGKVVVISRTAKNSTDWIWLES